MPVESGVERYIIVSLKDISVFVDGTETRVFYLYSVKDGVKIMEDLPSEYIQPKLTLKRIQKIMNSDRPAGIVVPGSNFENNTVFVNEKMMKKLSYTDDGRIVFNNQNIISVLLWGLDNLGSKTMPKTFEEWCNIVKEFAPRQKLPLVTDYIAKLPKYRENLIELFSTATQTSVNSKFDPNLKMHDNVKNAIFMAISKCITVHEKKMILKGLFENVVKVGKKEVKITYSHMYQFYRYFYKN
jgi:hypothetical protein